ncbi:MAG: DNA-binding domain-containing protein [Rhodoferax sp.]
MNSQTAFALPLLNPELPPPSGLSTCNGSDPALRYAVYRNNVTVSLIDALADTFGVVQQLVGEDFFRAMARVYAQANPPQSRIMAFYGQGFADFIVAFPPAAPTPYLADVARLEMAYVQAYHAADATALNTADLQAAMAEPAQLETLRLTLHPSAHVLSAPYAVVSIWAAHQGEHPPEALAADTPENALVFRHGLSVHIQTIPDGSAHFLTALQRGVTLLQAADEAADTDANFDLTQTLALLLRWQLLVEPLDGDPCYEYPR